jgi:hypothetical protein
VTILEATPNPNSKFGWDNLPELNLSDIGEKRVLVRLTLIQTATSPKKPKTTLMAYKHNETADHVEMIHAFAWDSVELPVGHLPALGLLFLHARTNSSANIHNACDSPCEPKHQPQIPEDARGDGGLA